MLWQTKPLDEFARSRQSRDGRTSLCKSCDAQRARERYRVNVEQERARARTYARSERGRARRRDRYSVNPDHYRARARAYARTDRGREVNRAAVERWRAKNPEAAAAHRAFRKALRAGEITKASAWVMGCERSTAYADYRRPLAVAWLCRHHHERVHHGSPLLLKPGSPRKHATAPKKRAAQLELA